MMPCRETLTGNIAPRFSQSAVRHFFAGHGVARIVQRAMHGGGEPGITRVNLSPRMRLAEVIKRIEAIPMGGTDCALPMLWAARNKLNVSGFVTYTDSETWAGNIHPAQALRQYRSEFVGDAKAIVVGMTSNGFTLADPNDRGMLDVVGFDTSVPAVIADFVRG